MFSRVFCRAFTQYEVKRPISISVFKALQENGLSMEFHLRLSHLQCIGTLGVFVLHDS